MAANGRCSRRATGVSITPTTRQAIKAPVAALYPSTASAAHLNAWASMPTATGQAIICVDMEKKTL